MNAHRQPTADTRTLHRLDLPAHLCDTGGAALRRALYVDCETTGLNVEHDQAIELALLPFTYAVGDGRIAEVLHHEAPGPPPRPRPPARPVHHRPDRSDRRRPARTPHRRRGRERAHRALESHRRAQRPF